MSIPVTKPPPPNGTGRQSSAIDGAALLGLVEVGALEADIAKQSDAAMNVSNVLIMNGIGDPGVYAAARTWRHRDGKHPLRRRNDLVFH